MQLFIYLSAYFIWTICWHYVFFSIHYQYLVFVILSFSSLAVSCERILRGVFQFFFLPLHRAILFKTFLKFCILVHIKHILESYFLHLKFETCLYCKWYLLQNTLRVHFTSNMQYKYLLQIHFTKSVGRLNFKSDNAWIPKSADKLLLVCECLAVLISFRQIDF